MKPITRLFAVLLCALCSSLNAAPPDKEAFTKTVLAKLQAAVPNHTFVYQEPLEIRDKSEGAKSIGSLYLDRIYTFVVANEREADAVVAGYVERVRQVIADADRPLSQSDVRLALRNSVTLNQALQQMGTGPKAALPKPLIGEFMIVPVVDSPSSVKYVSEKDLATWGIDERQVFELGERNLRASWKTLAQVAKTPPANGVGVITEEYAASRLIFPGDWSDIAKGGGGNLIVMAPAFDTVLYGNGDTPIAVDALKTFGLKLASKSQVPLSPTILRWEGTRWAVVK